MLLQSDGDDDGEMWRHVDFARWAWPVVRVLNPRF
jgi:hypothetical protein